MSRKSQLLCLVTTLIGCAFAEPSSDYTGIFKTTSLVAMEWVVNDPLFVGYPTEDVAKIENGVAQYYSELLAEQSLSAFQPPNRLVDVTASMLTQEQSGSDVVMEAMINVYHVGDTGIADLSDLLRFVTNKNMTGSGDFIIVDSLIEMGVKVDMVSFAESQDSEAIASILGAYNPTKKRSRRYTSSERTLIVVTSVLSVALISLSVILVWVAGGWLALRKQLHVLMYRQEEELTRMDIDKALKWNPTQDTDDEPESPRNRDDDNATQFTNPSGILGVHPYYGKSSVRTFEGLGVKMTPVRTRRISEVDSSAGMDSPSSQYSDSGRMPIGIQSMRKLLASRNDDEAVFRNPSGMKRLDYDE